MIKTLKRLLTTLSIGTLFAVPTMAVATLTVHAQDDNISQGLSCGVNLDAHNIDQNSSSCATPNDPTVGSRVDNIIHLVINIFSLIVGVVSVIMIIIGGLKYITSGGDSGNITGAKNTILYAIIGLVVVALAQVVVRFVLAKAVNTGQ
jgi:hypothetical protein